jgi:hypothetical protein
MTTLQIDLGIARGSNVSRPFRLQRGRTLIRSRQSADFCLYGVLPFALRLVSPRRATCCDTSWQRRCSASGSCWAHIACGIHICVAMPAW